MEKYYRILGVRQDATIEEIKKAYRQQVRKYHPDVNSSRDAARKLLEVQKAYEELVRQAPTALAVVEDNETELAVRRALHAYKRRQKKRMGIIFVVLLLLALVGVYGFSDLLQPSELILTHGGKTWELDLKSVGYDGKNPDTINRRQLGLWLELVKKEVDKPAVDARMKRLGDPIQPSRSGMVMDTAVIENEWISRIPKIVNRPQEIPMIPQAPKVTEEQLQLVDRQRIGKYTTYFNPENQSRTENIRLSSRAIDGVVLNPGDVFSFNQTVGQRTVERGYQPVTKIVQGEYSEGVGGGVSQTSSTLFNCVDNAGLEVLSRFSYSKTPTYVPAGRDATVAWNEPDFRFRNNLNAPVVIRTKLKTDALTVEIYSTPDVKVDRNPVKPASKLLPPEQSVIPDQPSDHIVLTPDYNRPDSHHSPKSGSGTGGGTVDSGDSSSASGSNGQTGDLSGGDVTSGDTGGQAGGDTSGMTGSTGGTDTGSTGSSTGDTGQPTGGTTGSTGTDSGSTGDVGTDTGTTGTDGTTGGTGDTGSSGSTGTDASSQGTTGSGGTPQPNGGTGGM
ncbi:VanW family protein [Polycladomyces subterraneus]|uniref:VanW family protein n=1 Tax=Polycladomyces subterraneus TaxID=1016997 RepID=A0ABT8IJC3_9BACL|nr:VanW family protein [Polycladomyces subterraneus]MDN4592825.1 VanW family protein [Polycladomyces subterraneus]